MIWDALLAGDLSVAIDSNGDAFDNRAIYVTRFAKDGTTDRVWTVDLDSEDMEAFWQRNPIP